MIKVTILFFSFLCTFCLINEEVLAKNITYGILAPEFSKSQHQKLKECNLTCSVYLGGACAQVPNCSFCCDSQYGPGTEILHNFSS